MSYQSPFQRLNHPRNGKDGKRKEMKLCFLFCFLVLSIAITTVFMTVKKSDEHEEERKLNQQNNNIFGRIDGKNNISLFTSSATYSQDGVYSNNLPELNLNSLSSDLRRRSSMNDDIEMIKKSYHFGETSLDSVGEQKYTQKNEFTQFEACDGTYNIVEIALAYDSTYCGHFGGDEEKADESILLLTEYVSQMFQQQGLCTILQISHLEGHCSEAEDPYIEILSTNKSGCTTSEEEDDDSHDHKNIGALNLLANYWAINKSHIHRDVMHLLVGRGLECGPDGQTCVVGCAHASTLCDTTKSYGINYLTFTDNNLIQANILAHEIAHNCGASHIQRDGYLMYPSVQAKHISFSEESIYSIREMFEQAGDCIGEIDSYEPFPLATYVPTMSPYSNDNNEDEKGGILSSMMCILSRSMVFFLWLIE